LRDIADRVGITERITYGIVLDLAEAGYTVKEKPGRRSRYQIQAHLPLPEPSSRERMVGDVLALVGQRRSAGRRSALMHRPSTGLAKAPRAMVFDDGGHSRSSFTCHSACEF
jgi:hypothetical protein